MSTLHALSSMKPWRDSVVAWEELGMLREERGHRPKKLQVLDKYVLTETRRVCVRLMARDERGESIKADKGQFIGIRVVRNLTLEQDPVGQR